LAQEKHPADAEEESIRADFTGIARNLQHYQPTAAVDIPEALLHPTRLAP